ncbi:hypothetical protein IKG54_01660, partial [Candidatus Saccharibacteria bacterium]|nr:hypothetical protein [Candidatus Saccharibacteria bacterium]
GVILPELKAAGIPIKIGEQDGEFLRESGAEWYVYTSALPADALELLVAQEMGMKISKRDELIAYLVSELGLKMVAVAGTHGKTTTTGMIIWACLQLGLPVSYLIGTTLGFARSGRYYSGDKYFIYEADEYDRNFLHFHPWIGVVTVATYDHPDIYPTVEDYQAAFRQFEEQSEMVIYGGEVDARFNLAGKLRREDATTALAVIKQIVMEGGYEIAEEEIVRVLNEFPGVGRRFEKISLGVYSDYGHHPEEITATIRMALEQAEIDGLKGVVAIYEPHQNVRQQQVREGYRDAFTGVDKLYWLPTYLTREDPELTVITPEEFIADLSNSEVGEAAEADDSLAEKLRKWRDDGYLILLLTAGPADEWIRVVFS